MAFQPPMAGVGGRERNSFHGVILCSDTKSLTTLEYGFQYLQEIQLWLNPTPHHFTTGSTDTSLHQFKTTAHGKLTTGNHSLEFHTMTNIFLNVSSFTLPFL